MELSNALCTRSEEIVEKMLGLATAYTKFGNGMYWCLAQDGKTEFIIRYGEWDGYIHQLWFTGEQFAQTCGWREFLPLDFIFYDESN